ncbi:MAG: gamma-glutamylcyclotransferase [Gammaproteobacteria bacterium]|nr:gamma-glutamylcyclotransferase [Gammaproteobacteria bacterium]
MSTTNDPFVHLPDLRQKILEPAKSSFRKLDLAVLDEQMRKVGAPADWRHSDDFREASRLETLAGRLDRDLWVFAYASLMWDPAFHFSEVRSAIVTGFQRRFCVKSELGRGTLEKPGLMAGLDVGGTCHGLAFRVNRDRLEEETKIIWRREMLLHAYKPVFLCLDTPQGPIEALAFIVDHSAKRYLPNITLEQTARYMATGAGVFGSSLEYLESLADHFEVLGIEDDALYVLRDCARQIAQG